MSNFIRSSIAVKVQLSVQLLLLAVSIAAAVTFYNVERNANERGGESKIKALADGVINGANMLMLNGIISDVEQRKLFITKMGSGEDIKSLRIIRNKLVQKQYGEGLPEEQPVGDAELRALEDGKDGFRAARGCVARYRALYRKQELQRHQLPDVPRSARGLPQWSIRDRS